MTNLYGDILILLTDILKALGCQHLSRNILHVIFMKSDQNVAIYVAINQTQKIFQQAIALSLRCITR